MSIKIKPLLKNELIVMPFRNGSSWDIQVVRYNKQSALSSIPWIPLSYDNKFKIPSYFNMYEAELIGVQLAVAICNRDNKYDTVYADRSKFSLCNMINKETKEKAYKYITTHKGSIKILDIKNKFI